LAGFFSPPPDSGEDKELDPPSGKADFPLSRFSPFQPNIRPANEEASGGANCIFLHFEMLSVFSFFLSFPLFFSSLASLCGHLCCGDVEIGKGSACLRFPRFLVARFGLFFFFFSLSLRDRDLDSELQKSVPLVDWAASFSFFFSGESGLGKTTVLAAARSPPSPFSSSPLLLEAFGKSGT